MNPQQNTSKEYFRGIKIVHIALVIGPVFFGIMSFFLVKQGGFNLEDEKIRKVLLIVVPAFIMICYLASNLLFKNKIRRLNNSVDLINKMTGYRSALIIRYSLIEGPAFFAIVAYLLTSEIIFLGFGGLLMVYLLMMRPTIERAEMELELDSTERKQINDPDAEIA